jgi:uncharacterized membrane protein YkvA (DUF1232 family)
VILAGMPATPKPRQPAPSSRPNLPLEEFERYVVTHAARIAPSDVTALVGRAAEVRRRLVADRAVHPSLGERARVALALLADHAAGVCPQIPYSTVALLAVALLYYLAPMDVIPDFIPIAGTADDTVVLDIAWRLAGPGIQRYLDWKELAADEPRPARRKTPPARRARRR